MRWAAWWRIAVERARSRGTAQPDGSRETRRAAEVRLAGFRSRTIFRTPLTSMKAAVTSLLASGEKVVPQGHELLTIINEECDRLNHLVEEAAEMARLEAGEIELHFAPTSIEEVIQGALTLSKSSLGGARDSGESSPGLPSVEADLERAQDIWLKLIDNANLYSSKEQPDHYHPPN